MKSFYHNAGLGDMVYALPTIRDLGGGELYVGNDYGFYAFLKPLMEQQPYIKGFYHTAEKTTPQGFIDLTQFRSHPYNHDMHLVNVHREFFKLPVTTFSDYHEGWLNKPGFPVNCEYSVINITPRYRDKFFKWDKVVRQLKKDGPVYFIGFKKDYHLYTKHEWNLKFLPITDVLEGMFWVYTAKNFASNESFWLSIRQGFGLSYQVEKSPFVQHVVTNNKAYETILNPITWKLHRNLSLLKKYTVGYAMQPFSMEK